MIRDRRGYAAVKSDRRAIHNVAHGDREVLLKRQRSHAAIRRADADAIARLCLEVRAAIDRQRVSRDCESGIVRPARKGESVSVARVLIRRSQRADRGPGGVILSNRGSREHDIRRCAWDEIRQFQFINADAIGERDDAEARRIHRRKGEGVTQRRIRHHQPALAVVHRADVRPRRRRFVRVRLRRVLDRVEVHGAVPEAAEIISSKGDAIHRHGSGPETDARKRPCRIADPAIRVAIGCVVQVRDGVRATARQHILRKRRPGRREISRQKRAAFFQ